jgi:hypothetical protein
MTRFARREELEAESREEKRWLIEELERLRVEKGLSDDLCWVVEAGHRETATSDGRTLIQSGFRVQMDPTGGGEAHPLACFIPLGDVSDEDARETASLVLSLWLDRFG